jgi:hypothetical protein
MIALDLEISATYRDNEDISALKGSEGIFQVTSASKVMQLVCTCLAASVIAAFVASLVALK